MGNVVAMSSLASSACAGERHDRSVLEGAVALLRALHGDGAGPVSLSEASRRARVPKSTAFRLLGQLVDLGLVDKGAEGYEIGVGLFELGSMFRGQHLIEVARPFLEDLRAGSRETVHLAVLDGSDALYVERLTSHSSIEVPTAVGHRISAYATGVGKAMLAFSPPEVVEKAIEGGFVRLTSQTIGTSAALLKELKEVRTRGVAFDRGEVHPNIVAVAAPILRGQQVFGAISVTGPRQEMDLERFTPAVRAIASGIARVATCHT